MPTVIVNRDILFQYIGESFTDEQFDELCFEFGIELDGVTSEKEMFEQEQKKTKEGLSSDVLYKIEIPANRYDLLCVEGLALSLRVFLGKSDYPIFQIVNQDLGKISKLIIEPTVDPVRPFAIAAILRNIHFTEQTLIGFMELQDKLHQNICRGRSLVSMGTHDFDTVQGPFFYRALDPESFSFIPLNRTEPCSGAGLMQILKNDNKLKNYVYLLENEPLYPVIMDSNNVIMSLPPMINSEHSKIKITTRNVFLEITAKDITKANIVLNTLIAMFSMYSESPFTVEQVDVVTLDNGEVLTYPNIAPRIFKTDVNYLKTISGCNVETVEIGKLLNRMCLSTQIIDNETLEVSAPITRSDVLHACDIAEDLAISYGYNNIEKKKPTTLCNGYQQPYNKLTDLVRSEMAMGGYVECLTMALLSGKDLFGNLLQEVNEQTAVQVSYSKTKEFEFFRNSLIPGILKTIEANKGMTLPFQVFEISDVVLIDETSETGASNYRKLCFAYTNTSSGFEILQGMVDKFMQKFGVSQDKTKGYYISPSFVNIFFEDRQANIFLNGKCIGIYGIVHPKVLKNFGIKNPVTLAEIDIQHMFDMFLRGDLLKGFY